MQTITFKEAMDVLYEIPTNIKMFMFADPLCEICNDFKYELDKFSCDEIEIYVIQNQDGNPFPITEYPSTFVHMPNTPVLPRVGSGGTAEDMEEDMNLLKEALRDGRDYLDVREDYLKRKYAEA
jgi:hypothetical protein